MVESGEGKMVKAMAACKRYATLILALAGATAAAEIERIEPPNWRIGCWIPTASAKFWARRPAPQASTSSAAVASTCPSLSTWNRARRWCWK